MNYTLLFWFDLVTAAGYVDDRREPDDDHRAMHSAERGGRLEW